jgi:hypothetical protein
MGSRTIGDDLACLDPLSLGYDRSLIDTGILVRSLIFDKVIVVHPWIIVFMSLIAANNDPRSVNLFHNAISLGYDSDP